jgi:hypothetical protein
VWSFIDTQPAVRASANLCSAAIACRANGIIALAHFIYLYERLPLATTIAALEALLSWNVRPVLTGSSQA